MDDDATLNVKVLISGIVRRANGLHAIGDAAAKQAVAVAPHGRRAVRNRQNASRAARNCGTACEASLWLLQALGTVKPETAERVAKDAENSTADLEFEACILTSYKPEVRRPSSPRKR